MINIKENNYYKKVKISGWAKSKFVETNLTYPENINQIIEVLRFAKNQKKRVAIRGRGCSFGDQSYIKNEITCDLSKFNKIINFDSEKQLITVEAGISLIEIYKSCSYDIAKAYLNELINSSINNEKYKFVKISLFMIVQLSRCSGLGAKIIFTSATISKTSKVPSKLISPYVT